MFYRFTIFLKKLKLIDEDGTGGLVVRRERSLVVNFTEDMAHLTGLHAPRHRRQEVILHGPNLGDHLEELLVLVLGSLRVGGVLGGKVALKEVTVQWVLVSGLKENSGVLKEGGKEKKKFKVPRTW